MKSERQPITYGRRHLFSRGLQVAAGIVLAEKTLPAVQEIKGPHQSSIKFLPGQEERLATDDTIVINFAGNAVGTGKGIAEALLPSEEKIGAVAYTEYDAKGLNIPSMANSMRETLQVYGKKKIVVIGQSAGTQIAAQFMEAIGDEANLDHLLLLETPPGINYTDNPDVANAITASPIVYKRSTLLATLASSLIYPGGPLNELAAAPGLLGDQLETVKDGEYWLQKIAERTQKDNSKVSFLTLKEPEKDYITDAEGSVRRSHEIFGVMNVVQIGGRQEHGVPGLNPDGYNAAIEEAHRTARRQRAA